MKLITNTSTNCQTDIEKDEIRFSYFFNRTSRAPSSYIFCRIFICFLDVSIRSLIRTKFRYIFVFFFAFFSSFSSFQAIHFIFASRNSRQNQSNSTSELEFEDHSIRCTFPMSVRIHIDFQLKPSSQYYFFQSFTPSYTHTDTQIYMYKHTHINNESEKERGKEKICCVWPFILCIRQSEQLIFSPVSSLVFFFCSVVVWSETMEFMLSLVTKPSMAMKTQNISFEMNAYNRSK